MNIRERSGKVNSKDNLVTFLYILMRDKITPGTVEEIILKHNFLDEEMLFSNGWLAEYAKDIVRRLTTKKVSEIASSENGWFFDKDKIDEHMIEVNTADYFLDSIRDNDNILPEILMDTRQVHKVQDALNVLDSFVESAYKVKHREESKWV